MTTSILPTAATLAAYPAAAISFAPFRLAPFEFAGFLRDHREGKDLGPWLDALEYDHRLVEGETEEDIGHLLGK